MILGVLLVAGVYLAPFWTPGVFVVLAVVTALFAMHLTVGIVGYRHVMRRPWPQVEPLDPDDDDW